MLSSTIGDVFAVAVAAFGHREAVVEHHTGRRLTYRELGAHVNAAAAFLHGLGVRKGDRVGLWAPNCAEWIVVQFATAVIGAIQVNINPAYRPDELAYVLRQSTVRTLISARSFKSSDYVAMIDEVRAECPGLRDVVHLGGPEWDCRLAAAGRAGEHDWCRDLHPTDPINIQYTSGTTGFAKGATLSHRNVLNNGYLVGRVAEFTPEDRLCVPVPFYHCFGMVCGTLAAIAHGACVVIPGPSFEPQSMLAAISAERCTIAYGVPTMFIAALNHPGFAGYDLSSLRTGLTGGSPVPVEMVKRLLELMPDFAIVYGMTELSPIATQTTPDDPIDVRLTSIGRPAPHVEVKVVDSFGRTVRRGKSGELCVRGYSVMLGYWDQPDATAKVIDSEGWMHTGDLVSMNQKGYLSITGRIKDVIIRGGENIYPREVEEFLHTHPDVVEAQVIGVPDEAFGEEVMVWLRMRAGRTPLTPESVRTFCHGRLAHYKIPRYVHTTDGFPLTVTGKVRKVEMRKISLDLLGLTDGGISFGD
jgi:fatty-acyl-CoA synthase